MSDLARKAYVIGGDQVLALGDTILAKPDSMEAARRQLLDLSGKRHTLHTAVAVATNGETIWAETTVATLTMRKLSPEFIGRYLAAAGEDVLGSVGAYQLESLGVQLFEADRGRLFLDPRPASHSAPRHAPARRRHRRLTSNEARLCHRLAGRAFPLTVDPSLLAQAVRY